MLVLIQMQLQKKVAVSHVTTKAIHTVLYLCNVNYQSGIFFPVVYVSFGDFGLSWATRWLVTCLY